MATIKYKNGDTWENILLSVWPIGSTAPTSLASIVGGTWTLMGGTSSTVTASGGSRPYVTCKKSGEEWLQVAYIYGTADFSLHLFINGSPTTLIPNTEFPGNTIITIWPPSVESGLNSSTYYIIGTETAGMVFTYWTHSAGLPYYERTA